MLRVQAHRLHSLLVTLDTAWSGALFVLLLGRNFPSEVLRDDRWAISPAFLFVAMVACLAWPLIMQQLGLYESQRTRSLDWILTRLLVAEAMVVGVLTVAIYAVALPVPTRFPLLFGLAQLAVLGTERLLVHGVVRMARRYGRNTRNILVVGSGPRAAGVMRQIHAHPEWGLELIGFVDDSDEPVDKLLADEPIHKLSDMPMLLRNEVIDEVIIACPRSMLGELIPVVGACGDAGVPFTLLSDIFGDYLPTPAITRFGSLAALRFAAVHHNPSSLAVKRLIDIVGASAGLLLTAPVLIAAGIAIKLDSKGPVFFRQMRSGLYGRTFPMLKLRTMVADAEAQRETLLHLNEMDGPVFKVSDDPRVTRVGRFLRRTSLDELPQLWNVVRGEMSLVGPRPPLPSEVADYETFERRRLSMRPGLTCLWQVSGRNEVSSFEEWVRLDLEYIDTWSLSHDLRILLRTVPAVAQGTGAK